MPPCTLADCKINTNGKTGDSYRSNANYSLFLSIRGLLFSKFPEFSVLILSFKLTVTLTIDTFHDLSNVF